MNANILGVLLLLCLTRAATAQGFAGLADDVAGFSKPEPTHEITFPIDHGPHPDFRIEWWYVTANLDGANGKEYGLQWTLFRSALSPPGAENPAPDVWMGHAAVTSETGHYVAERFARDGTGQAGATGAPFSAWIDDWEISGIDTGQLTARGFDFAYALEFDATGPFVLQGDQGYSVKSDSGQASHYFSQPHYTLHGTLTLPEGDVAVTGTAWLDREWSSQPLRADQTGWDWFSLHFESGDKLMGFRLRSDIGRDFTSATWIPAVGSPTPLAPGALKLTPQEVTDLAGRKVPTTWRLQLPARQVDITVSALNPHSWMATTVAYWEGPVHATGSHPGRGYLEMTGYE